MDVMHDPRVNKGLRMAKVILFAAVVILAYERAKERVEAFWAKEKTRIIKHELYELTQRKGKVGKAAASLYYEISQEG